MAHTNILSFIYLIVVFSSESRSEISTANNQFGLKVYSALAEQVNGDFLIAPFPLSSILAQLNLGADGLTSKQIQSLVDFKEDASEVTNDYRRVLSDFQDVDFLGISSKIFVNQSVEVLEDFEEYSDRNFFSVAFKTNFNSSSETIDDINTLISNTTLEPKKTWVSEADLSASTLMALVTTSFFKGSWVNSFHPFDTKPSPFYYDECRSCANQVDMMFQRATVPYAEIEELDCTSISLPYRTNYSAVDTEDKESRIELIILLPNSRTGLKELENKLKNYPFSQITRRFLETRDLFIYMPKFNVSSPANIDFGQVLSKLGLESGFDQETADFSKLQANNTLNPLWISKVYQFAEFSTDEFGTKGVGSKVLRTSTDHYSPESFRVNRPFIGFLYDQERHIILNIFRKTS